MVFLSEHVEFSPPQLDHDPVYAATLRATAAPSDLVLLVRLVCPRTFFAAEC